MTRSNAVEPERHIAATLTDARVSAICFSTQWVVPSYHGRTCEGSLSQRW
ncbi:hypothetical protein [Mesorhizobium sp. WSM2239]|uniref:Uncharacterized protein n=2 Tax=unclassified Mesorhizobium TaxID=325217 RepID=A0AAU8D6R1_9HYPH